MKYIKISMLFLMLPLVSGTQPTDTVRDVELPKTELQEELYRDSLQMEINRKKPELKRKEIEFIKLATSPMN